MAYAQHTWTDGEVITKEKLNNIEAGIADVEKQPGPPCLLFHKAKRVRKGLKAILVNRDPLAQRVIKATPAQQVQPHL